MRRPGIVPEAHLAAVVTALYRDADDAGWETLGPRDRSRMYGEWVEAEHVGGVLTLYMTPEAARSWIKDGPMKEYARANRGAGRYAEFGREGGTGVTDVIKVALGTDARLVPGSEAVKPFRCQATASSNEVGAAALIVWGESRQFKDLLWAALRAVTEEGIAAHVVVMEPPGRIASPTDRTRQTAMARRCAIELHYMREVLGTPQGRA